MYKKITVICKKVDFNFIMISIIVNIPLVKAQASAETLGF